WKEKLRSELRRALVHSGGGRRGPRPRLSKAPWANSLRRTPAWSLPRSCRDRWILKQPARDWQGAQPRLSAAIPSQKRPHAREAGRPEQVSEAARKRRDSIGGGSTSPPRWSDTWIRAPRRPVRVWVLPGPSPQHQVTHR